MRIDISREEYETLCIWYNVVYGECCTDKEDDDLMVKLAEKFKDAGTVKFARKQDGT